jgi:hypothetical protein
MRWEHASKYAGLPARRPIRIVAAMGIMPSSGIILFVERGRRCRQIVAAIAEIELT